MVRLIMERCPPSPHVLKRVLLALGDCDRSDNGTSCFPSIATIGFIADTSESHTRRALRELERIGYIRAAAEYNGGDPRRGRQYIINVAKLKSLPTMGELLKARRTPVTGGGGSTSITPPLDGRGTWQSTPCSDGGGTPSILNPYPLHFEQSTPSTGGTRTLSTKPNCNLSGPDQATGDRSAWWKTDEGTIRKGRHLGIDARVGEEMSAYRQRLWDHVHSMRANGGAHRG